MCKLVLNRNKNTDAILSKNIFSFILETTEQFAAIVSHPVMPDLHYRYRNIVDRIFL